MHNFIPLWTERQDISVSALWKAYCQFPYLPRLASRKVLEDAISEGTSLINWHDDSFAYAEGYENDRWVGLKTAERVLVTPGGLLVHPEPAKAQIDAQSANAGSTNKPSGGGTPPSPPTPPVPGKGGGSAVATSTHYFGTVKLSSVRAIKELEAILQNVVDQLSKAPSASVEIAVDISATSSGFDEQTMRAVRENANQLKFTGNDFSN